VKSILCGRDPCVKMVPSVKKILYRRILYRKRIPYGRILYRNQF
jgi:hypothetical protein